MTNQVRKTGRKTRRMTAALLTATSIVAVGLTVLPQFNGSNADASVTTTIPAGTPVSVATPLVRTITEWDEYTGRFEAMDHVEIRARVSGYLTEIAFEPGEIIEVGDLLFRIDPRPFETALSAAKAHLAGVEAALRNAQDEADRGRRLVERQAISSGEADRRIWALKETEAARAAAKAAVDQAELDLEFTEVRSPIRGRISDDYVSVGNLIVGGAQGGTVLTTVVSQDPIHFEFTVSEADHLKYTRLNAAGDRASSRDVANPVRLKLADEDGFTHEGVMTFVDNQLDRSTGTMRGQATFGNAQGVFAPGMFGRLQLIGSGAYQAVLIPDTAVQTDQSQKFVWVANNQTAQRRPVELGPMVDGLRVVRTGLSATDQLIVAGTQFIGPGSALSITQADAIRFAAANPAITP